MGDTVHFCVVDGSLSSRKFGVGTTISKIQRSSRTPRWHCERWFRIIRSICWTRIISITDVSRKSHGHYFKTTRMTAQPSRGLAPGGAVNALWDYMQEMQYPLKPRSKWKMLTNYWKFQSQNVQTFGFVYRNTTRQNHGPVWKTQLFFLKGICTVILCQDYCGKGNLRKSYWNMAGRKFQIGNVSLYIVKKDYSYLCMWMTSIWLEGNKILIECGKISWKTLIWENQHHFLTMNNCVALKENVKEARILWQTTEILLNPGCQLEE